MEVIEIAVIFICTIFFGYGLIQFILNLFISKSSVVNSHAPRFVLEVLDNEDSIEGVLRMAILNELPQRIHSDGRIYVVDKGSTDNTKEIVQRLTKEYPYIKLVQDS